MNNGCFFKQTQSTDLVDTDESAISMDWGNPSLIIDSYRSDMTYYLAR